MSTTGLEVVDDTLHNTNSWLKEIAQSVGPDRRAADRALCAVLHALRDRLTVDEAAYFDDQVPMLVRGLYFDGLHPAGKPHRLRSREEFLRRINDRLHIASIGPEDPRVRFSMSWCIILLRARSAAWWASFRGLSARCAIRRSCNAGTRGVARMRSQGTYAPGKKNLPALRTPFLAGHKDPQQLPTWHGRRRPIIRPKADCS